jgi:hypothetical protein
MKKGDIGKREMRILKSLENIKEREKRKLSNRRSKK